MPAERRKSVPSRPHVGYGHKVSSRDRVRWQQWADRRAQDAFENGRVRRLAGDFEVACLWFDRAARMARDNPHVLLELALAQFGAGRLKDTLETTAALAVRWASREVLSLRIATFFRLGLVGEAAEVLEGMLQSFAPGQETGALAAPIAQALGLPGWCGVTLNGEIRGAAMGPADISLDGRSVRGRPSMLPAPLPGGWEQADRLHVTYRGEPLLGSPINLMQLRRSEGCISPESNGWRGWIWHPGDPDYDPCIHVGNAPDLLSVSEAAPANTCDRPLARPRSFFIRNDALQIDAVKVRDGFGHELAGSPISKNFLAMLDRDSRAVRPLRASAGRKRSRGEARLAGSRGWLVIIPVYRDVISLRSCVEAVLADASTRNDVEIVLVDDASPENEVKAFLRQVSKRRRGRVLRHSINQGFPAAVNTGLAAAQGRDVILLNSDTLVPDGWISRLERTMRQSPDIATVTPFSNDASIFSYPSTKERNIEPTPERLREIDASFARLGDWRPIDVPTGNGFCMAIRAECLAEVGMLRNDLFAQGYGEENDFCLRASAQGWRHVAAPSLFVSHLGSQSFGGARRALMQRNQAVLNLLHPGYAALVQRFIRRDPLAAVRRSVDIELLQRRRAGRPTRVLIRLDSGGGVARAVRERGLAFEARGDFVLVIQPHYSGCRIDVIDGEGHNLIFALPDEEARLVDVLRHMSVGTVEWHHMIGHAPVMRTLHEKLGVKYDIFVHDYTAFCPRVALAGPSRRYCGEPDIAGCEACVRQQGSYLGEDITVLELVARSRREFDRAGKVMVPSEDVALRLRRHFPSVKPQVQFLEDDTAWRVRPPRGLDGRKRRIGILGGIGVEKGYDIVQALAHDAASRELPVDYVVIGHTLDDEELIRTGKVWVTGEYKESEVGRLIRQSDLDIGFLPSVCPETWCFALGDLWREGLPVAVFDLGALAERVRRTGLGWAIPLGVSPEKLNEILLSL